MGRGCSGACIIMKICSTCDEEKDISSFTTKASTEDGLNTQCKACVKEYSRKYYKKNQTKCLERNRSFLKLNPEYHSEYYVENKEEILKKNTTYNKKNRDRINTNAGTWRKKNPNKVSSYLNKRRTRKQGNGGSYNVGEWQRLKEETGNICLCCGISGNEVTLTVDHVIPISRGGRNCVENLQPLCQSCNSSKGTKSIDYRKEKIRV